MSNPAAGLPSVASQADESPLFSHSTRVAHCGPAADGTGLRVVLLCRARPPAKVDQPQVQGVPVRLGPEELQVCFRLLHAVPGRQAPPLCQPAAHCAESEMSGQTSCGTSRHDAVSTAGKAAMEGGTSAQAAHAQASSALDHLWMCVSTGNVASLHTHVTQPATRLRTGIALVRGLRACDLTLGGMVGRAGRQVSPGHERGSPGAARCWRWGC